MMSRGELNGNASRTTLLFYTRNPVQSSKRGETKLYDCGLAQNLHLSNIRRQKGVRHLTDM